MSPKCRTTKQQPTGKRKVINNHHLRPVMKNRPVAPTQRYSEGPTRYHGHGPKWPRPSPRPAISRVLCFETSNFRKPKTFHKYFTLNDKKWPYSLLTLIFQYHFIHLKPKVSVKQQITTNQFLKLSFKAVYKESNHFLFEVPLLQHHCPTGCLLVGLQVAGMVPGDHQGALRVPDLARHGGEKGGGATALEAVTVFGVTTRWNKNFGWQNFLGVQVFVGMNFGMTTSCTFVWEVDRWKYRWLDFLVFS